MAEDLDLEGKVLDARVRQKKDTLANWEANELILLDGEQAFVVDANGQPINFKIGDGTKKFADLPYWIAYDQGQYVAITGTTLPTPTATVGYSIVPEGTYTRAGQTDVVVPAGSMGVLNFGANTWSLGSSVPLPSTDTSQLADADRERAGKNFVDLTKKTANKYVQYTTGNLVDSTDYDSTDFIYIAGLEAICISHFNHYALYNADKQYLSGKNAVSQGVNPDLPWPLTVNDAVYIRASIRKTIESTFQIEEGSESTTYEPYESKKTLKKEQVPNNVRTVDKPINQNDLSFGKKTTGKNMADKSKFTPGRYVDYTTGNLQVNASYNATDFIPVNSDLEEDATTGLPYTFSYRHTLAWFKADFTYISGVNQFDTEKTKISPLNARYLRATVINDQVDTYQVEKGYLQTPFEPYSEFTLLEKTAAEITIESPVVSNVKDAVVSIQGQPAKRSTSVSLATNTSLVISDFPFHIKKNVGLSASCKFTGLSGKIIVGKGFNKYRGSWIEIDSTNIVWKFYESSAETRGTVAHGLTLQDFISVSMFVDDKSVCHITLHTKTNIFQTTFQWGYEFNYEPIIRTEGQTITDVLLTASSLDFQKTVWAFGDSYFGFAIDRWPYWMKQMGYINIMFDALAGQNSPGAVADLQRCLRYGTPKYIVWCLGMNDSDPAVWQSNLDIVKGICEEKGIELILATIPTVPTRNKETISNYVRSSGFRYVDFYKAVGTNSSGTWIDGYLSTDGVHPTEMGAKALAMRVLVDFPEILQYGLANV